MSNLKVDLTKCLKGEEKGEASRRAFYDNHIAPLQNPQGVIDWKSGAAKEVAAMVRATVQAWYVSAPRVVDGHVIQPVDLKAALAPTAKGHAVRAGALAGITTKAWRWTGKLVADYAPAKTDSKAPSGAVAVSVARSKARKGKNKAAKVAETPVSVPMLSEALRDAIAKLKPQSRIAAANQVMDFMRNIISEARAAIDTAPRKAAKPRKADKAAKVAAPAPAAVQ